MNNEFQPQMNVQLNTEKIFCIINNLTYKENWSFSIGSYASWQKILKIQLNVRDSNPPIRKGMTTQVLVDHQFPIPPYFMTHEEAERWILDCTILVEQHEACEFFRIGERAPFYPNHDIGGHPYRITRRVNAEEKL